MQVHAVRLDNIGGKATPQHIPNFAHPVRKLARALERPLTSAYTGGGAWGEALKIRRPPVAVFLLPLLLLLGKSAAGRQKEASGVDTGGSLASKRDDF